MAPKPLPPIEIFRLLAYKSHPDHTELKLLGGEMVRVRETTDQIDHLLRGVLENMLRQVGPRLTVRSSAGPERQ